MAAMREASRLVSEQLALIESIGDPTLTLGLSTGFISVKQVTGARCPTILRWSQNMIDIADGDPVKSGNIMGRVHRWQSPWHLVALPDVASDIRAGARTSTRRIHEQEASTRCRCAISHHLQVRSRHSDRRAVAGADAVREIDAAAADAERFERRFRAGHDGLDPRSGLGSSRLPCDDARHGRC